MYFNAASGFSLTFGLMRTVNMAHGSLYLIGAYAGIMAAAVAGVLPAEGLTRKRSCSFC